MASRTLLNLIAIAVASGALLLYAGTTLLAAAVLDRTYPLILELERADGLLEDKEVTYNGVGIGQIEALELVGEGARVHLRIDEDVRVPTDHDVVILRSSPIGEQALDIRPFGEVTDTSTFHERGDTLAPREVTMPPPIQGLLELADEVFEPLDKENVRTVVGELADAFRGRRDDVRSLLADSARFSGEIADRGEDYDRLFASSRVVNRALAEHRETLARFITDSADATTILSDIRSDFEGLLVDAPLTLNQVSDLVEAGQANLSCVLDDFGAVNAYLARPRQLENGAEALRQNQFFFQGFNVITPRDASGDLWQRVHVVMEEAPPPETYLPEKRPIPDILPGGACTAPFGRGAPAAHQAGFAKRVPDAQLVPPADNRRVPYRRGIGLSDRDASGATSPGAPGTPSGRLPATGGLALPLLLGAGLMAIGARGVGHRRASRDDRADGAPRG